MKRKTSNNTFIMKNDIEVPLEVRQTIYNVCRCFSNAEEQLLGPLFEDHIVIYVVGEADPTLVVGVIQHIGECSTLNPTFITLEELKEFIIYNSISDEAAAAYLFTLPYEIDE